MEKFAKRAGLQYDQLSYLIDQWIFSERDRAIAKRSILDGIAFEPLAEEFYLSVQQTKTIVYRAQKEIFSHIRK